MTARIMRKVSKSFILAGILAGMLYGQTPQKPPAASSAAQTSTTPPAAKAPITPPPAQTPANVTNLDKVVMKVGDEKVTQADIEFIVASMNAQTRRALAVQGRRKLGEDYATLLALEQRALSEHLDASPDFARKITLQRRQLLAEAAYNEIARQATVRPEDTSQYYTTHPEEFEQVKIRQVVIRKRSEGAAEGTKGLPLAEAQTRAEAIRKALQAGTEPKKVVEQFQVPEQIMIDAEPRSIGQGTLRPDMQKAAAQLKDGEVSEVFDLPQVLMFFQVASHHRMELKEVSAQIENTLRQNKIKAALEDLRKQANIWTDDTYFAGPEPPPAEGSAKTSPAAPAPPRP